MSLFGQKKSRTSRALRVDAASQFRRRLTEMIRDRSLWLRTGIVAFAVLALLVVVEGWEAPFPYRLNDLSGNGIEAAVDFQRVDRLETERQRDRRESETPPVFRNDPTRLAGLPARFRDHLTQVALVRHLDELPTETRIAFGLAVADTFAPDPETAESLEREFAALKAHVAPQEGVMGAPFDETCEEFARLVEPLGRLGLVDPQELERLGIPIDRPLAIDTPVAAAPGIPVAAAEPRSDPPHPALVPLAPDTPAPGGPVLVAAAFVPPGPGGEDPGAGPAPAEERPPVPAVAVVPEPAAPAPAPAASQPGRAPRSEDGQAVPGGTVPPDGRPRFSRSVVSQTEVRTTELVRDTGRLGRALSSFPRLEPVREFVRRWLVLQAPVSLQYDALATQLARSEARRNVPDHTIPFTRGMRLVGPGERIDAAELEVLEAEHEAVLAREPLRARLVRAATVLALLVVLIALQGTYMVRHAPQLVGHSGRLALYLTTIVVAVLVARWLSYDPWRAEIIPVMAAVAVLAIAYDQVLATFTAVAVALLVSVSTAADLGQFMVLLAVSTVAIVPLRSVPSRSSVVKVGFLAAATYVVVHWGLGLLESRGAAGWTDRSLMVSSLRGGFWCLVAGYLVSGSLPFVESAFGVVTDISLLEMSDVSHPLLQELVRRAPGTYNHSVAVATIGEAAADRIGANGLLVRVGAYFHDIGKMLKPQYFVENMTEGMRSRHENLAPAMSTLIIIGHVKDGVDLARRHHLPRPLVDFIEQHHGTTLVEYFYREAARTAEDPDEVQESAFRYPGPKPQTRETGVLMLADAVESASRTLSDPTPKRIEGLVHDITMKKLLDGQFEESNLTLSEISAVEDSLCKSLIGIYHGRIKYPDQRSA